MRGGKKETAGVMQDDTRNKIGLTGGKWNGTV